MPQALRSSRRRRLAVAMAAAVALVTAACGGSGEEPTESSPPADDTAAFPTEITDGAGQTFSYDEAPAVACLWSGCDEIMADFGIVPAGTTLGSDDPFYFAGAQPTLIEDYADPEEWVATGADVIVVGGVSDLTWTKPFKEAADVFALTFAPWDPSPPAGVDAHEENVRLMGQLLGLDEAAIEARLQRYDELTAAIAAAAPEDAADTEIAVLYVTDDGTYELDSPESVFCTELARLAIGRCAAPEGFEGGTVNAEAFLELDPEWIAYQTYEGSGTVADRNDKVWMSLTAPTEGRAFDTVGDYTCCSLRNLEWALRSYATNVWGVEAGFEDPGPMLDFDPAEAPLPGTS